MSTIVLKDKANADVTFTLTGVAGNSVIFDNRTSSLLGRKRLTLTVNENKNTNRVAVKLSIPSVCVEGDSSGCTTESVKYTQVASADITVVRFSSLTDREDLAALFGSLVTSAAVEDMVTEGVLPQ